MITKYSCLLPALLIVIQASQAQELDLFQAIENQDEAQDNTRRAQRTQQTNMNPAFTLVGTSRFGDKYIASLLSRNGDKVVVEWADDEVREIKGYRGFSVADMGSRRVTIDLPEGENCVDNEAKGVKCNGTYALLTLSNAQPIEQQDEPVRRSNNSDNTGTNVNEAENAEIENGESEVTTFINPFTGEEQVVPELSAEEQAARDARRARRAEQFQNFEIVRIADDEIPEGMRRVRSPFGDRLEPIEE